MRPLSFLLVGCLFSCAGQLFVKPLVAPSATEFRSRILFNEGWRYLENNTDSVVTAMAATNTTTLDLPHTWNQWDATDNTAGYRRDASWYLKELTTPADHTGRVCLYFEGANTDSEVYVNGQRAGGHVGGYVGFRVDVTDLLRSTGANLIAVRVTNAYNPDIIPSQKSDFFIYGGLTRDVWLELLPETHLDQFHVSTPEVNQDRATTTVHYTIKGNLGAAAGAGNGKRAVRATLRLAGSDQALLQTVADLSSDPEELTLPVLDKPQLWSPASPTLYELDLELLVDNRPVDKQTTTLGYRFYDFVPNGPFRLNGERLLLRGTHRHEEHAGYGAAMPNELHRRDLEMIKEMGANFVRLGHYPQDPEVYRAADELGLILWDELPWCRGGKGEAAWEANTKRLLREQINQNYNHPSIFFWSLGNEIYWLPDFPGGDDPEAMNRFLSELNDIAHELDPHRLTAIRKYYAGADLVDVFSPSIWSGWYAGVYSNYAKALEDARPKYPRFLHMEYGGSSHVGRHTETPVSGDGLVNPDEWAETISQVNVKNIAKSGDWTENYIVDLFDWHLSISETSDWFAGNAQWAFKDFGTPLRPENAIPYLNQKGLVDRAGNPKDAYYVYKSYWAEPPFTYIESHTWTERSGPAGKARTVKVFSNCEEVELFHAGKSLGRKERQTGVFPAAGLHWELQFISGDNPLSVRGYRAGKLVAEDQLTVNYVYEKFGRADRIVLEHTTLPNGNLLVEATMRDKAGRRVLNYEDRVYFATDGASEMLVDYGTPTRSRVVEMANGRAAIELIPAAGRTVVEARNQDFKGSYLVINCDEHGKASR